MSLGQLRSCVMLARAPGAALRQCKRLVPAGVEGQRNLSTDPSVYSKAPWPYEKRGFNFFYSLIDFTTSRLCENSVVISVDGPPSCGKTEIAKSIAQEFNLVHMPAPTENDIFDVNGFDLRDLNPMLDNKRMWSYDNEMMFNETDPSKARLIHNTQMRFFSKKFHTFLDALRHVLHTGQGVVVENSIWSDAVYAETLYRLGYTSRNAIRHYKEYRTNALYDIWKPQLVLHIEGPTSYILDQMRRKNPELADSPGLNEKFVDTLKDNYKQKYLPYMNTFAEVLSYDVTDLPDMDLLTLDLEKTDLANRQEDMPKRFDDWIKRKEEEFSMFRLKICNKDKVHYMLNQGDALNLPEEELTQSELLELKAIRNTIPQLRYRREVFYNKDGSMKDDEYTKALIADSPMAPASTYGDTVFESDWRRM